MKEAVVKSELRSRTTNIYQMINLLKTVGISSIFCFPTEYERSLYSTPKNAYRLPAKDNHRTTMIVFLGGALDIFECTLKRVLPRSSD